MGVPTGDNTIIENFMLQQIRDGEIRAYLSDLLLDFSVLREYGEGKYFWGVRSNGCGSDIICCNRVVQDMREYRGEVRRGRDRFDWHYPLAWFHAFVNGDSDVSFGTAYQFNVKSFDGIRCEGKVEQISKDEMRQWLHSVEQAYERGTL
jgi:hypothetical protein